MWNMYLSSRFKCESRAESSSVVNERDANASYRAASVSSLPSCGVPSWWVIVLQKWMGRVEIQGQP